MDQARDVGPAPRPLSGTRGWRHSRTFHHMTPDLRHTVTWAAVSVGTLATLELALHTTGQPLYTHLYRRARSGRLGWVPVAVAVVTVAHLEGWLPPKLDPFTYAGRLLP